MSQPNEHWYWHDELEFQKVLFNRDPAAHVRYVEASHERRSRGFEGEPLLAYDPADPWWKRFDRAAAIAQGEVEGHV